MITAKELRKKAVEAESLNIVLCKILDAIQEEALKLANFGIRTDLCFSLNKTDFGYYTDSQKRSIISALIDALHNLGYGVSLHLDYYDFGENCDDKKYTHICKDVNTDNGFFYKDDYRLEATSKVTIKWCEEED